MAGDSFSCFQPYGSHFVETWFPLHWQPFCEIIHLRFQITVCRSTSSEGLFLKFWVLALLMSLTRSSRSQGAAAEFAGGKPESPEQQRTRRNTFDSAAPVFENAGERPQGQCRYANIWNWHRHQQLAGFPASLQEPFAPHDSTQPSAGRNQKVSSSCIASEDCVPEGWDEQWGWSCTKPLRCGAAS